MPYEDSIGFILIFVDRVTQRRICLHQVEARFEVLTEVFWHALVVHVGRILLLQVVLRLDHLALATALVWGPLSFGTLGWTRILRVSQGQWGSP